VKTRVGSVIGILFLFNLSAFSLRLQDPLPTGKNLASSVEWFLHRVEKDGNVEESLGRDLAIPTLSLDEHQDLILQAGWTSSFSGVWGIEWRLDPIPLHYRIIVPGRSGIQLTKETPGRTHVFDYPMEWEAQLVLLEGDPKSMVVWAKDSDLRFKRLTVQRDETGWRLGCTTFNQAPFELHSSCESCPWHINLYEGDWRIPAKRYRDWAERNFRPTPLEKQSPNWVKDIRCCVILELDEALLDPVSRRLDATQTLLYIPGWRKAGYDRDYPVYDEPVEALDPFLDRAHRLGFKVMLHVNYFGCDPLNPLYEDFKPYQVRSPWSPHQEEWWLWERTTPVIRFAYINPAHKPWRDLFVERMVQLCRSHEVDALHLDQTLCIYNDHNGPMQGLSMAQGNILLHKELREALPGVALSGEGLNEITYRYEAFAQRHAWGIHHADGIYEKPLLQTAHPICSYLFLPYTRIYGYLGVTCPTESQLYAAWQDAYEHWGVIPTLKTSRFQLENPIAFSESFFKEASFFFQQRLEPDLEGAWPEDAAFLFRTQDGRTAIKTTDHRFLFEGHTLHRTLTGVQSIALPGTIPGWKVFDEERLFGLDPQRWYPYLETPRDLSSFHVADLPDFAEVVHVVEADSLVFIQTRNRDRILLDLTQNLDSAVCRSEPFQGAPQEMKGPLDASDGAFFRPIGNLLHAHPPWKVPGSGISRAQFRFQLPSQGTFRFITEVTMDPMSVGTDRTDGVTFGVRATDQDQVLSHDLHQATSEPMEISLDLTPLAGKEVLLDLTVHPGPNRSPSFDWARWIHPRIEQEMHVRSSMDFVGLSPGSWALGSQGILEMMKVKDQDHRYRIEADFPGTFYLLKQSPKEILLPLNLTSIPFETLFLTQDLERVSKPVHAQAVVQEGTVGGVLREGLFTHPPNHGQTRAQYLLTLPPGPIGFHAFVGIRDGAESEGCLFLLEVNGMELARVAKKPGAWSEITADLSGWENQPILLSLVTDSDGPYFCDWAHWGQPRLEPGR